MKAYFKRHFKCMLGLLAAILALSLILWVGDDVSLRRGVVEAKITEETVLLERANPEVQAVMALQNRHTPDLMALPEVVGTATGLTEAGRPAILVLTRNRVEAGMIPPNLEGVPVVVKVTGEILAMPRPPGAGRPGGGGGGDEEKIDPTGKFPFPVPIGVSTGNEDECSAGTIGARVTDGTEVYALSNNHVYALENLAASNSQVVQPGLYDTNCYFDSDNVIGQLVYYEPIDFDGSDNYVDAAFAESSTAELGNSTPSDGYGTPKSMIVPEASVGQLVQKYGRTTSLTKGEITGVNATVNVGYSSGTARFVDQIVISSNKGAFIKAGDSGSLLVTDPDRNPVGLLFAGNRSGKTAIANPIDAVLSTFGVSIDGE